MKNDKNYLSRMCRKMIEVFGDNAKVGLCFLVAATFRKIIRDELSFFQYYTYMVLLPLERQKWGIH